MKYVRQNEPALLDETDAAVVAKARDLYGEAVEASVAGSTGVVGAKVRQAFALVNPSCSTSCPLGLCSTLTVCSVQWFLCKQLKGSGKHDLLALSCCRALTE